MAAKKSWKNPLFGTWKLVGADRCPHKNARPQDECVVPTYKAPKHYSLKIYGKEASVVVPPQGPKHAGDDHMYITSGTIRYTEYYGKDSTKENGTPCYIEWMDANTIKLTFKNIPSGTVYHEMWERVTCLSNWVSEQERSANDATATQSGHLGIREDLIISK